MHLRSLPFDHLDLPHFSRVSWMAYSDAIRPFLEGLARFTEIVWCHRRDQRVLQRQDLDLRIGDRLLGLHCCDERHDPPHRRLRWRRLKQARDRDENATDRDQTRGDTNKRLEPGQCGTERRETLPESHQAAGRPGGSRVATRRCHGSALSLFDWITAPTRHTAAIPCKQGECRAPTINFLGRYRRKPPWTRQNDIRLGSRLPSRQKGERSVNPNPVITTSTRLPDRPTRSPSRSDPPV